MTAGESFHFTIFPKNINGESYTATEIDQHKNKFSIKYTDQVTNEALSIPPTSIDKNGNLHFTAKIEKAASFIINAMLNNQEITCDSCLFKVVPAEVYFPLIKVTMKTDNVYTMQNGREDTATAKKIEFVVDNSDLVIYNQAYKPQF